MKLRTAWRNPATAKRLRRFREKKRAWWSLWILAALYAISLASELICNDRPLYLRMDGHSYFPACHYYAEQTFVPGGRATRPDYKKLNALPTFRDNPANFMVFAPIPYGPYESIDPQSIQAEARVIIALTRIPRVGNVNLTPELTIAGGAAAGFFFGTNDDAVAGLRLADHWQLSSALEAAIAARFRNETAAELSLRATPLKGASAEADLALPPYEPRTRAPRTVRLTFRQPVPDLAAQQAVTIGPDGKPRGAPPPLWLRLPEVTRTGLLALAHRAFDEVVYPEPVDAGAERVRVEIQKNDISWPHPPVRGHRMGIDSAGRDVLARILYGLRISMTFGFLLVLLSFTIGIAVGAAQGYFGGVLDITGQRLIEIWSALPFFYVMILMGSVFGQRFGLLLFVYGIFNWIGISYYVRAEFLRLRKFQFVEAAKCMAIPSRKIIFRHILPNALTPVITFFPFSLVGAIGSLAALDYLGFGLPPPTASWGELLHQAQQFRWAWWLILYPSLALFVVMLLGVFVGEGVRDAYDPQRFSRME